jgi:hypothetical protein
MKVVINVCHGGFSLSNAARAYIANKYNKVIDEYAGNEMGDRTDPALIDAVETLGKEANGTYANLKIVEVPDDVKWHIAEYDGDEWVAEDHRKWS